MERSDGQSGLPLNDEDFPYKLIVRNREEFIRLADEVVVAMMEADKGSWSQIEAYIEKHSDAQFSHSICPECAKKLYPEFGD